MTDLYLEQEEQTSPSDHSASDEEEEALRALLAKIEADELAAEDLVAAAKLARRQICSCGFFTCGAIGRYGHPLPVFKEDIEPLWPQGTRDQRALELKGAKA